MAWQFPRFYYIRHVILVLMRNIKQEAKDDPLQKEAGRFS